MYYSMAEMSVGRNVRGRNGNVRGRNVLAETSVAEMSEHHAIASKNEYTHDVKAGLSPRWTHMGYFVLLVHSCSIL